MRPGEEFSKQKNKGKNLPVEQETSMAGVE